MKVAVPIPQNLADAHTQTAQKYAGHFVGHPYRAGQQRTGPGAIRVDYERKWQEPAVFSDRCDFCRRLTDESAVQRVAGYQHALDIEVMRARAAGFADWLAAARKDVPDVEEVVIAGERIRRGVSNSAANRRAYIERHEKEFDVSSLRMIDLPLRLKRKLCIEWNHLYRDWLTLHPKIWYDFEDQEFYREVDERVYLENEVRSREGWAPVPLVQPPPQPMPQVFRVTPVADGPRNGKKRRGRRRRNRR